MILNDLSVPPSSMVLLKPSPLSSFDREAWVLSIPLETSTLSGLLLPRDWLCQLVMWLQEVLSIRTSLFFVVLYGNKELLLSSRVLSIPWWKTRSPLRSNKIFQSEEVSKPKAAISPPSLSLTYFRDLLISSLSSPSPYHHRHNIWKPKTFISLTSLSQTYFRNRSICDICDVFVIHCKM